MSHSKTVDGCLEEACDTGVLNLSGRSLRNYPVASEEEAPFAHKELLELDISKNRFHELPALVYTCEALVKLTCYHNVLRNIPDGFRRLHNLKHVNLNRNFLTTFPIELCHVQLQSLSINNNRIDAVPLEIGRLKELHSLDVSNNCLEKLPASISELTNLKRLDFHSNKVVELPPEICELSLTDLIMFDNLISKLPTAVSKMRMLVELQVDGNPMTIPPPQICGRGKVHIFKYLSRLEQFNTEAQINPEKSLTKKSRKNIQLTYPRFRPMSNISNISDEPGNSVNQSMFEDLKSMVSNAFGSPYEHSDAAKQQQRSLQGDMSKYNGTIQTSDKPKKGLIPKQTSGSPGASRRAAQYGVTLPRKPSREGTRTIKPPESHPTPTTNAPVVNSHNDMDSHLGGTKASISPPIVSVTTSNRKLPADPIVRPGSWNSSHSAGATAKPVATLASPSNTAYSHSQTDVSTDKQHGIVPKPRGRSKAMSRDDVAPSGHSAEDILAPMRKNISSVLDLPKSPSPSPAGNITKALSTAAKLTPITLIKDTTPLKSRESTPDLEIKTPMARNQPDSVPLELDSVLSSLDSDLEKEEMAMQQEQRNSSPKPSPRVQKKTLPVTETTKYPLAKSSFTSPSGVPSTSSPRISRRPVGSPSSLKKKSATIASSKDVELRIHNPNSPSLSHRQSFPPRGAEWVDNLFPTQKEGVPVLQQLTGRKPANYTIQRQKKSVQAELEMIELVKDSVEMMLNVRLGDDVISVFSNGVVLCQLVNRLFPNTIPSIMDTEPMNNVKRTKNIDSFLGACDRLGIKTMCKVGDILDCKNPLRVCNCVQELLSKGGHVHSTV